MYTIRSHYGPQHYSILNILIYLITVYITVLIINMNFIIRYFNSYCKRNGIPLSATLLYLKNVFYWPEDDRLRSKYVAVMWPECIYFITVMIYCCVLTVCNILHKFVWEFTLALGAASLPAGTRTNSVS